ncbi:MAG: hypothetical protein IJV32_07570 [Bacteroidales bacterium]|jgi:hypothetical protein|nr:hypothetical protein [Bacteroidales bacterium]
MKIQLIGFDYNLNPNSKLEITKEIINSSEADLLLFPGHTLRNYDDLDFLEDNLTNSKTTVVLEMEDSWPSSCLYLHNALFLIKNGESEEMFTSQVFATAEDINGFEVLMEKLFDEIPRRQFECCGKRFTVLLCGETALLASAKAEGYKASFRFKSNPKLNKRYEQLLASTDVFLNPIHDLQGEQGVMSQRRATLSADGRYYLSTCALNEEMWGNFNSKRIQYISHNGEALTIKPDIHDDKGYVSRIVEIK